MCNGEGWSAGDTTSKDTSSKECASALTSDVRDGVLNGSATAAARCEKPIEAIQIAKPRIYASLFREDC